MRIQQLGDDGLYQLEVTRQGIGEGRIEMTA